MVTTSEIVVTATIWVLTATGGFFGMRAAVRRKREKRAGLDADKAMRRNSI
ncbi:hypothetical protein [Oryzomonas japonica]|uniref:hypothetical protein n=1 Tax=Oryzomonas japonica TaxID=2603858 RepID=UPI001782D4BE|nr:hypothetical protein [Oryzomonas japonica]